MLSVQLVDTVLSSVALRLHTLHGKDSSQCSRPSKSLQERKVDMNARKLVAWIGTPALLLGGFLATSSVVIAAEAPDSEQVSKLLSEAKTMAFQLREDAASMERFTRVDVSWETHADAINQIKEHVNALARTAAKLKDVRGTASPWQKTAIDRINPFLDELGGYTTAAIEHISGKHDNHTAAEYNDFLEANADYSADLAAMIGDFVDYGKAKHRMERLGSKLEVPGER
jgi:hypothetical protein